MSSQAIRRAAPANPATASSNASQIFTLASNSAAPAIVQAPGKLVLDGRRFTVRAEGNLYTAATYTALVSLYGYTGPAAPATPLTAANWTLLGAGTARSVANVYVPWWIEANLIFDSNGGALQGSFQQMVNNLFNASAATSNQLTGINGTNLTITQGSTVVAPTDPAITFAVGITFGTAGLNIGNLVNFEIGF